MTQRFMASNSNVWRSTGQREEFFQQCATQEGARALADLLNQAAKLVEQRGSMIVSDETVAKSKSLVTPGSVVAHAIAKVFNWQLELPNHRAERLQEETLEG